MNESKQRLLNPSVLKEGKSKGVSSTSVDELLKVNQLNFRTPKVMSVVTRRTNIKNYFEKSSYTNTEVASIIMNSGSNFVDWLTSYLCFDLNITCAANSVASFGNGSAMNLIKTVSVFSASGTEIDRVQEAGLRACVEDYYTKPRAYFTTLGTEQGYKLSGEIKDDGDLETGVGTPNIGFIACRESKTNITRFVIPMSKLSKLFASEELMPSFLASGLRIDIEFAVPQQAFLMSGTAATVPDSYNITNANIMTDSFMLSDAIHRKLRDISASDGLEYAYLGVAHTSKPISSSSETVQSTRAVSRAYLTFGVPRDTLNLTNAAYDYFQASPWDITNYQANVASAYFPLQQLVQGSAATDSYNPNVEFYRNAQYTFEKVKYCNYPNNVNVNTFTGATLSANVTSPNMGIIAALLSRSGVLDYAGIPISSSRTLEFRITFATATPAVNQIDLYTIHQKIVSIYLDRCIVME